ncbi:hypothetical protein AT15_00025 [Kosmotoga arenicorallina S304]|uniref:Uncharacterized protein n=1 Tax=Kosmotoga arenicorallina S304 TaxID=1453497 RepID=A0A182C855_9BACT|nr:hypothetical protein [Kosmotoga arenicorallina]OAA32500.1 hypothetical protein AT15_00025 [Kosmotoga arenicorallina S304]
MAKEKRQYQKTKKEKEKTKQKKAILEVNREDANANMVDNLITVHNDEKAIEPEMPNDLLESTEENNDETISENAFAEALYIGLKDLGLEAEERPQQASVDRIIFNVLKSRDGYICVNSGIRSFGYRKNLQSRYQNQLLLFDVTERIKKFIECFLNGFYEFEKVTPYLLRNTITSKAFGTEYRSLLTKNYMKFWNGDVFSLNIMTFSGRPSLKKQAMAFIRFALGADPDLKEELKTIVPYISDKNNVLKKTERVNQFLEKVLRLIKNHFVDVNLSLENLYKTLSNSKEFKMLLSKLRGNKNG